MGLVRGVRFFKIVIAASLALGSMACSDSSKPAADNSRYYRMKVGLTYKGQPVDIDFVAGCGVHFGHDVSGGSIKEIAGMTDLFRGVRMPEDHAVVINTYPWFESPRFNPCDGDATDHSSSKTIDTSVPKDWLPFIVWFERDDQFAHGIGYLTQDAYESKTAHFGFRYARIEHATKAEFESFRKMGPANLLPPHQTDWMVNPTDPLYRNVDEVPESVRRDPSSGWWKTSGRTCHGVIRKPLAENQRAILRRAWPKDHPDYWTDEDLNRHLPSHILRSHWNLFAAYLSLTHFQPSGPRERPIEVFPIASSWALSRLTPITSPIQENNVLISDNVPHLGQVFCDIEDGTILPAVIGQRLKFGCIYRIDGVQLSWNVPNGCFDFDVAPFFYRDEYVIATIRGFRS